MSESKSNVDCLGDGPIQDRYHKKMNAIANALDRVLNGEAHGADRESGFVLLVYPLGNPDDGRCNFISNGADRRDIVVLFKEIIARFEGQSDLSGRA